MHCRPPLRTLLFVLVALLVSPQFSPFAESSPVLTERSPSHQQQRKLAQDREASERCSPKLPPSCKTQPCFLFKASSPHQIVPERANSIYNKTIFEDGGGFPCKKHNSYGVKGLTFELLDDFFTKTADENYQCFYVGNGCTWTTLFDFTARNTGDDDYQTVYFSALLETAERRNSSAIASFPIHTDHMATIGWRYLGHSNDINAMFEPLDGYAVTMLLFSTGLCSVSSLLVYFSNPLRRIAGDDESKANLSKVAKLAYLANLAFASIFRSTSDNQSSLPTASQSLTLSAAHLSTNMGNTEEAVVTKGKTSLLKWQIAWHRLAKVILTLTIAVHIYFFLILYEAALTNFLFQTRVLKLDKPVTEWSDDRLSEIILHGHSALYDVFETLQDNNQKKSSGAPWKSCATDQECFEKILSEKQKYGIFGETNARYMLKEGDYCGKLDVLSASRPLYTFNNVMYYSANIDPELRRSIDNAFREGRFHGQADRVMKKYLGNTCIIKEDYITIRVILILVSLICASAVLILGAQVLMLVRTQDWWRRIMQKRNASKA